MNDKIIFIRHADGDIEQVEEHDMEHAMDTFDCDTAIIRVDSDIVQFIEDSSSKNPENYPKQVLTDDDIRAMAFMAHNSGSLYMEVLVTYTGLVQGGMHAGPAAYAALLSWDISVEDA